VASIRQWKSVGEHEQSVLVEQGILHGLKWAVEKSTQVEVESKENNDDETDIQFSKKWNGNTMWNREVTKENEWTKIETSIIV